MSCYSINWRSILRETRGGQNTIRQPITVTHFSDCAAPRSSYSALRLLLLLLLHDQHHNSLVTLNLLFFSLSLYFLSLRHQDQRRSREYHHQRTIIQTQTIFCLPAIHPPTPTSDPLSAISPPCRPLEATSFDEASMSQPIWMIRRSRSNCHHGLL